MRLPQPVAGVRWRAGGTDDVDAMTQVGAAADAVDEPLHVVTRSDTVQLLRSMRPGRDLVLGERAGRPVAFGALFRPGGGPVRLRGAVDPAARGEGIGRVLLAALLDGAMAQQPDAPAIGLRSIGDAGVAGLARRAGFHEERTFVTMRRDLEVPVDQAEAPAGIDVTDLAPALDERVRLAKNAAFRDHWQGLEDGPEEWRTRTLGEGLERTWSRVALAEDGAVAAFVIVQRSMEHRRRAHIPLVGTARTHRRRGLAHLLLRSALAAAAEAGCTEALLDVDASSPTGAGAVYEGVGFTELQRAIVWQRPMPGPPSATMEA